MDGMINKELTVLYAEDDLETQSNYNIILEQYFKYVYLASNGEEALRLYTQHKPDVVLLDVSMPLIDGLEVAKTIRKTDKETRILMFTAHSERERLLQAVNLHLDEYLLKPVDIEEFQNILLKLNSELVQSHIMKLHCDFTWDKQKNELFYNNEIVNITKKENALMQALCANPDKYFTTKQISLILWNEVMKSEHNNRIKQLVSRFKQKISQICDQQDGLIENSYSYGYKIKLF
ncbi:MAG: response regulator transcription factor [Campylobacterota bacterium]|nr:response regulator transcription factor [Campylobacterota bacterium]